MMRSIRLQWPCLRAIRAAAFFTLLLSAAGARAQFSQIIFGDITVQVNQITNYNAGTGSFTGTFNWGPLTNYPANNLTVAHSGNPSDPASVTAGSVAFLLPQPYKANGANFSYTSGTFLLAANGAGGQARVLLPSGLIHKQLKTDTMFREDGVRLLNARLDQNLVIAGDYIVGPGDLEIIKPENDPYSLRISQAQFNDSFGFTLLVEEFIYSYSDEFNTDPGVRSANDAWMRDLSPDGSPATITPGGLNFGAAGKSGDFTPAFPLGLIISVDSTAMTVANSRVTTGAVVSDAAVLSYYGEDCGGGVNPVLEQLGPGTYDLGPDGALLGVPDASSLGNKTYSFASYDLGPLAADGKIYIPGWRGPSGANAPLASEYLLAGRKTAADSANSIVLFGEDDYTAGAGSYAGYNLSQSDLSGKDFSVKLACKNAPFSASFGGSKLYIRESGLSGTLDASEKSVAALPPLNLYNEYNTILSRFNVSLLDNKQQLESEVNGKITLPFPADTELSFTNLEIELCGALGTAKLSGATNNVLAYWNREFNFSGIEFRDLDPPQETCGGVAKRTLWATSTNKVPNLAKALLAETNFAGSGDIRESKVISDPANTVQDYPFSIRKLYYSKWDGQTQTPKGLTAVIGDIRLPFWGATPVVALWDIGSAPQLFDGRSYAADPPVDIDTDRNGFPSGITSIEAYLDESSRRPEVKGTFANLIPLDYRVAYNNTVRKFATAAGDEKGRDLVVLNVSSSIRAITRDETEILFGVSYEGFPTINLSSLLEDFAGTALEPILGPLKDGMNQVKGVLGGGLGQKLRASMGDLTRPKMAQLVSQLRFAAQDVEGAIPQQTLNDIVSNQLLGFEDVLREELSKATSPIAKAVDDSLAGIEKIQQTITDLDPQQLQDVLALLVELTGGDPSGIEQVFGDVNEARKYIVENLIKEQLKPQLQELRSQIGTLQNLKNLPEIQDLLDGAGFDSMFNQIESQLFGLMGQIRSNASKVRNLDVEKVNTLVVDTIFNSVVFSGVQQVVSIVFEPLRAQVQGIVNGLFDTLNNQLKAYIELVGGALNKVTQKLNDVVGVDAAEISGYAVFGQETLDRLHVEAEFGLSSPDKFSFRGSLDMERFKNNTNGVVCGTPAGGESIKIKIAVYDIPLKFPRADLKADEIALLLRLNDKGQGLYLSDIGGKIETSGSLNFEAIKVLSPAFAAGVGENETYIAFSGSVVFNAVSMRGGIFLGKTCNGVEILKAIDPEVEGVITQNEISGIYAFGEAAIPIINYGCFLRVGATAGAGFWYFTEGPTYGGKLTAGVYGEGLCLISVRGKIVLIGGKEASGYFFKGTGWVAGGLGWCEPETWFTLDDVWVDKWCWTCALYLDVLYKQKEWSIDYDADCE